MPHAVTLLVPALMFPPPLCREQTESPAVMPPWEMPPPMGSTLDFYDTFLPLRVSNSLTRTVTPFVPMLGKRVLW